jgi:ABC-type multidrug transport system fused ATPase/permease subunit
LGSEQIKNWPLIRNFGLVRRESEKYRATVDKYTHSEDERRKIRVKQWIVQNSVLNISTLSVGLYLVWMWKHGNVSVGNATLVILWFAKIYVDMYRFSNFQREVQEGIEALSELITMVETPSLITEIDNPVLACGLSGEINFENVSFAYEGNEDNALDSVTCVVPAGSTLAVVGESGSGKSTLVSMLLRDYDPVIGRISIGGVDLRHLSRTDYLQNMLAIVSQDPMLGDGAIAMALVKDPRILILDEATSSLDEPTQARVKANLDKRNEMRTCTNIVIAHRFSTIENADLVLLLDGGLVAGFGTIEELKESSALFRRLERQDYLDSEV